MNTATSSEAPGRLQSLDAYRGFIMFTLLCGGLSHSLKGHPVFRNLLFAVAAWGAPYWFHRRKVFFKA
jgi:hypothetical protein